MMKYNLKQIKYKLNIYIDYEFIIVILEELN